VYSFWIFSNKLDLKPQTLFYYILSDDGRVTDSIVTKSQLIVSQVIQSQLGVKVTEFLTVIKVYNNKDFDTQSMGFSKVRILKIGWRNLLIFYITLNLSIFKTWICSLFASLKIHLSLFQIWNDTNEHEMSWTVF
jgi:hypothetical protein